MIGILARGCVFTLLDPTYPPNYLRELAEVADTREPVRRGHDVLRCRRSFSQQIRRAQI
jgi:hypothetical protein